MLPFADGLGGDAHALGQLVLGHAHPLAVVKNAFAKGHGSCVFHRFFLPLCLVTLCHKNITKAIIHSLSCRFF